MTSELERFKGDVRALGEQARRLHDGIRGAEQQVNKARASIAKARGLGASTSRLEQLTSAASADLRRAHAALDALQSDSNRYADTV
ncbi:hypothetical protein ACWGJ9_09565 [Curtobacterium citreum]